MFNRNIEALKLKNAPLAEELEKISLEEASNHIKVYEAETKDLIIAYDDLALDDIYDPIRVAKTNWNKNVTTILNPHDIVVVYGLGLGYLFKRAYVSCECKILLYEPKLDILRYVLNYIDFSAEIADERVSIAKNDEECFEFIAKNYLSQDKLNFIFPAAYQKLLIDNMINFTNKLVEVCNLKQLDIKTVANLSKQWAFHEVKNINNMASTRPLCLLENKYEGKTALIAGAGPSLAKDFDTIKSQRDKFVIFAVNKSLRTLFENGIIPDFVMFSDTQDIKFTIDGIEELLKSTQIIADVRSNPFVYELNKGQILNYYSQNDNISHYFHEKTKGMIKLYETVGTATGQAFFSAKALGFKKIIFSGLDLAFKDNIIYADGQNISVDENNIIISDKVKNKKLVQIKDLNGNMINTRDDYAMFVRQFNELFAKETQVELYNTTGFGAFISNMKYLALEEIAKGLEPVNVNIAKDMGSFFNDTAKNWAKTFAAIQSCMLEQKEFFEKIAESIAFLIKKEELLLEKITPANDFQEEMLILAEEFSQIIKPVIENHFLSQYLQNNFMTFTAGHNQPQATSVDDIIKLKNQEISLLKAIVAASNKLASAIQ
ncbi:MAG: DUF115 domain-containing protein [Candidatus Gastranaerophilales bacterium]|nr:DUF115 domain-containing protein [Candidatus Gastranaerophilales bacterium]